MGVPYKMKPTWMLAACGSSNCKSQEAKSFALPKTRCFADNSESYVSLTPEIYKYLDPKDPLPMGQRPKTGQGFESRPFAHADNSTGLPGSNAPATRPVLGNELLLRLAQIGICPNSSSSHHLLVSDIPSLLGRRCSFWNMTTISWF